MRSPGSSRSRRARRVCLRFALVLVGIAFAALTPGRAGTKEGTATPPSLTGLWVLNPDESEDPMEKMREAMMSRRGGPPPGIGGGPGPRGGGGGMGGGRPPGGGPPRGGRGGGGEKGGDVGGGPLGEATPRAAAMKQAMADLVPPETLRISGGGGRVFLDGGTRGAREIHTEPRPSPAPALGDESSVVWPGRWEKESLVLERQGPEQTLVRESYRLKDKGRRLEIRIRVEGTADEDDRTASERGPGGRPLPSFEFKRIYERSESGAGPGGHTRMFGVEE